MKPVLIFAYYSFRDPVFQSAVLPYFWDLAPHGGCRFVLLTFEKTELRMLPEDAARLRAQLRERGIFWHALSWHSGRFKLLKKAYDFCLAILYSLYLIARYRVSTVYSEAFPGAIITHFLTRLTGCRHVVHTFEPHADSTLESGVWTRHSWEYRLLKRMEAAVARGCSHILSGTQGYIEKLRLLAPDAAFHRVPSCVDLDHFRFDPAARSLLRREWGIAEERLVLVYLGKFGGMYWDEELPGFFLACKKHNPLSLLLVITPEPPAQVRRHLLSQGVCGQDLVVQTLRREQIPGALSAADVGICAVRPFPAKRYCSPIKDGEYWAVGLPIVIPVGVSDDYRLAVKHAIGVTVPDTSPGGLRQGAEALMDWLQQDGNAAHEIRGRARQFVEEDRSVASYRELYRQVLGC